MGHQEPGVYFRPRFHRLLTHAAEKLFSIHVISKNEPLFHSPDDDGVQGPLPTQPGSAPRPPIFLMALQSCEL